MSRELAENVAAAFISSDADPARGTCLSSASKLAQASFLLYAWAHQLVEMISFAKRSHHQTELKDMRTE